MYGYDNMPTYLFSQQPGLPLLTLLIAVPLIGMLLIGLGSFLKLNERLIKIAATAWSLIPIGIAIVLYAGFDAQAVRDGQQVVQFVEKLAWTRTIAVDYFLGIDGLSLPMVLLTALITPIAMLASFRVERQVAMHYALIFLLESAMLGYFVALNFFFFFIFWEFSLVPAFFLIQQWGRDERRRRSAAFTFFVYTFGGSIAMLLIFLLLYAATAAAGRGTFDLIELARLGQGLPVSGLSGNLQDILFQFIDQTSLVNIFGRFPLMYTSIAFWGIFIGLAIKLAIWPFHTWLPDAYAEAPVAGSVLLAAVMSKMGAYGMLRILLPLFPEAASYSALGVGILALIGVLAGAFGAYGVVATDMKRLIAYTSINHMGYVGLAVAALAGLPSSDSMSRAIGMNGAVMQMVAHGLSTAALFVIADVIYNRTGTYRLASMGGLRNDMPRLSAYTMVAVFANLGLPGLAGFIGEFMIMRAVWSSMPWIAIFATLGLVVTALALLQMYGRIFHGSTISPQNTQDLALQSAESWALIPLLAVLLFLGIYPAPILDLTNAVAAILAGR